MQTLSTVEQAALTNGIHHVWKVNHVKIYIRSKHNISLTDDQYERR